MYGGVAKWLRQRSAKPLFIGSTPIAASILSSSVSIPKPFCFPSFHLTLLIFHLHVFGGAGQYEFVKIPV